LIRFSGSICGESSSKSLLLPLLLLLLPSTSPTTSVVVSDREEDPVLLFGPVPSILASSKYFGWDVFVLYPLIFLSPLVASSSENSEDLCQRLNPLLVCAISKQVRELLSTIPWIVLFTAHGLSCAVIPQAWHRATYEVNPNCDGLRPSLFCTRFQSVLHMVHVLLAEAFSGLWPLARAWHACLFSGDCRTSTLFSV